MRPTVTQVAAEDPQTEAKIVQPSTLVCSRRPGSRFTQGARPRNRFSERLVRYRISPIQMNRGRAVRVQLLVLPQIVMAMASPAARLEKNSMPNQATPARVRPTQTPPPSSAKRTTIRAMLAVISFMVELLGGGGRALARQFQDELVQEGDEEDQGAHGHGDLGDPHRRGVDARGDVLERPGLPHQAYGVQGQKARQCDGNEQGDDFERP